jgi:hypothetical protein
VKRAFQKILYFHPYLGGNKQNFSVEFESCIHLVVSVFPRTDGNIMSRKVSFILALALVCQTLFVFAASGAIIVESSGTPLSGQHNISSFNYGLVDETGGNSSSLLLVGVTAQNGTPSATTVQIDTGGGATNADFSIFDSGNGVAGWWVFDLGDVTAGNITILNDTANLGRETYTVLQLSGASASGLIADTKDEATDTNTIFQTELENVAAGSFLATLGFRDNNQNPAGWSVIGPSDVMANGQFNNSWFYSSANNLAGGTFNTGFNVPANGQNTDLAAIAIAPLVETVPEPLSVAVWSVVAVGLLCYRRMRRG